MNSCLWTGASGWGSGILILAILFAAARNTTGFCPRECACFERLINCSRTNQRVLPYVPNTATCVDLSNNMIRRYPVGVLDYGTVEKLLLPHNQLEQLPPLRMSLSCTKLIDLSHNRIAGNLSSLAMYHSLEVLNISWNAITSLGQLKSHSLQTLDASHCAITSLEKNSLLGLNNLTRLLLAGNPLKSIKDVTSSSLVELDLSACKLSRVDPGRMTSLQQLDFSNNSEVFKLYATVLAEFVPNLNHLAADWCTLEVVEVAPFVRLVTLQLSFNRIHHLPSHAFANNTKLESIDLSGNMIQYIDPAELKSAKSIKKLDLSFNKIKSYDASVFSEMEHLSVLNLSRNPLGKLGDLEARKLLVLDASHCEVESVSNTFLGRLNSIQELNLSHNSIELLSHGLNSNSLVHLDLSYNFLSDFKLGGTFPNLKLINLTGNRLTEPFDKDTMMRFHSTRILLVNNPWRCDCSSHDFIKFHKYIIKPPYQKLICQSPENTTGYTWDDACFNSNLDIKKSTSSKPWIPLAVSLVSIVFVVCLLVCVKGILDRTFSIPQELVVDPLVIEQPSTQVDVISRLNQLPSYEEALLLPKLVEDEPPLLSPAPPYSPPPPTTIPAPLTSSMFNLCTQEPIPTSKMSSSI